MAEQPAPSAPQVVESSLADLVERARSLAGPGRSILGLVGAPGAGKSTVAGQLAAALGDLAVVVEMDGFHLSDKLLVRLGRRDRKGAIDTFDGEGFVALVGRLKASPGRVVYAPEFDRRIDQGVVGAIEVGPAVRLVIITGNYLLVDAPPWADLRHLMDQAWFLQPTEDLRLTRLIERHVEFGKSPEHAQTWVRSSDERNTELVRSTAAHADLVVRLVG